MVADLSSALPHASVPAQDGRILLDAALLKRLRKARALSQEALAELCFHSNLCVSIASIKRAETGKVVLYRTARHLAQILCVELEQLMAPGAAAPAAAPAGRADDGEAMAAAPGGNGFAAAIVPQAGADDIVRYVVALHIELADTPRQGDASLREIGALVQQFGGRVDTVAGQQVTAVFGLPQAYRSDADRCIRCAIELGRRLLAHGGRAMALRLARWGQENASPDGQANVAVPDLRSFDRGEPGALTWHMPIYVARGVAGQLTGSFVFESGAQRFPGYQLFSKTASRDRAALPALIGRYTELRQFKAVLEAMEEGQAGHLVYLRAMAGVGKSRLAQEFADLARQNGVACHVCAVPDAGADSWRAPLEQLVRSLFGLGPEAPAAYEQVIADTLAELRLPAESLVFYLAICAARMTPEQAALFSAMSHEVRERGMARALQVLILRLAMDRPLLITVEDVHWGDAPLFEALGALLTHAREAPVIWVLTSRQEQDPLESALRPFLFDLAISVFDLAPMAAREAAALADQFTDVAPAYRRRCVERAQGNALFLTQLLASPEDELPDSLKHLIQSRLDSLAPPHRQALRMAAVIGNRVELDLLRSALGDPDYALQAAGRNTLVRPIGGGVYVFVHDLVMHCIYESIEPQQLRRLHGIAAEAYRERDAALCAHHLYRANDPGALDMMLRAIRARLASHQFEAALDLTAACHAADSTSYSSFALALLKAHAIAGLGRIGEARQGYETALMLAGPPHDRIDAVVGLATTLNMLEELEEEERLLDETLPLALSIGADAALGKLLYLKGNIYFPRGNYSECRRYHEDAARYAKASAMTETQARALSGVGDSYYAQGRMQKANELFGACIAMCEEHRLIHIEASNRSALGSTRIYLGQAASASADALDSAEIARKVGNRRAEIVSRMTAGWVMVAGGQVAAAEQEVGAGLELARAMGSSRFEPFLMESQARISWLRGERALAEQQISAAAHAVERMQLHGFIGPWVLGTLALFSSDPAVRKRALLKGAACLTRDCLAHNAYRFYVTAAEVALLDGDTVSAEFYAEQLAGFGAGEPCTWVEHHVELIRQYVSWKTAPGEQSRDRLVALRGQADEYGFAQATPRLHEALLRL